MPVVAVIGRKTVGQPRRVRLPLLVRQQMIISATKNRSLVIIVVKLAIVVINARSHNALARNRLELDQGAVVVLTRSTVPGAVLTSLLVHLHHSQHQIRLILTNRHRKMFRRHRKMYIHRLSKVSWARCAGENLQGLHDTTPFAQFVSLHR